MYTNLDNRGTFTEVFTVHSMDLKVVDNGDGTLTITSLQTGWLPALRHQRQARPQRPRPDPDRGPDRDNGTPDDPFDDEFLEDHGLVKGSTGRNDTQGRNFCEDLRQFSAAQEATFRGLGGVLSGTEPPEGGAAGLGRDVPGAAAGHQHAAAA